MMGEVQPAYPRGLDFEQVWAGLEKTRLFVEGMVRRQEESDRQLKEMVRETDRQLKEMVQETDRQLKETDRHLKETDERLSKQLGKLGGRLGEMIEYMVKPNLIEKFRELGFVFTKVYQETEIKDKQNNIVAEVDFTMEDGDKVMIVEVKSKPSVGDVKDHLARMEKVRLHADLHGDGRRYLGAVAGMVMNENARDFALRNGFYVIEPSGDTFTVIVPRGAYRPREW
ncbi:MAG: hypothetical protein LBG84_08665 [Treponema sp.]|nr:hypothetical protein [Treponema sp.]